MGGAKEEVELGRVRAAQGEDRAQQGSWYGSRVYCQFLTPPRLHGPPWFYSHLTAGAGLRRPIEASRALHKVMEQRVFPYPKEILAPALGP